MKMTEEGGKAWRGAASAGYGKRIGSSEPGKEGRGYRPDGSGEGLGQ